MKSFHISHFAQIALESGSNFFFFTRLTIEESTRTEYSRPRRSDVYTHVNTCPPEFIAPPKCPIAATVITIEIRSDELKLCLFYHVSSVCVQVSQPRQLPGLNTRDQRHMENVRPIPESQQTSAQLWQRRRWAVRPTNRTVFFSFRVGIPAGRINNSWRPNVSGQLTTRA